VLHKHGGWYADWEDEQGQRKRKSFPTKKRELKHQSRMRAEAAAKKARASGPSHKSARRGSKRTPTITTPSSQQGS
jgi:hypothetical protein